MAKAQWNWNVGRPLNNTPLPGKLDWERFLGNAPKREVEPRRLRHWRYFRDYAGGNMTDQGTHLMDVVQWFGNVGAPRSATAMGVVAKMEGSEHADVFSAILDHGSFMTTWTLNYNNDYDDNWSILFQGDAGTMRLTDSGFQVWKELWRDNRTPVIDEKAPVPIEPHIQNFLECIRSRKQPNATVEVAQRAVAGPHLANIAMDLGRQVRLAEDMVTVS